MRIADCRRAILAAVAAITCSLASPVHAQERPTVLPECAPGVLTLASAFIPQTTTGSLQNLVDEWLNEAATDLSKITRPTKSSRFVITSKRLQAERLANFPMPNMPIRSRLKRGDLGEESFC